MNKFIFKIRKLLRLDMENKFKKQLDTVLNYLDKSEKHCESFSLLQQNLFNVDQFWQDSKQLYVVLCQLVKDELIFEVGMKKFDSNTKEEIKTNEKAYAITLKGQRFIRHKGGYKLKSIGDFFRKEIGFWLPIIISIIALLVNFYNPTTDHDIYEISQEQVQLQKQLKELECKSDELLHHHKEQISESEMKTQKTLKPDSTFVNQSKPVVAPKKGS